MATLYNLTDTMKQLLNMAQSGEVEQETIDATIESMDLEQDIEEKIDGYIYVMDELDASNERIQNEIKRLRKRKKVQENNKKRMQERLYDRLKLIERDKVQTDKYTVSIRKNPPKLVVNDESNIPKRFYDERLPKLNKRALLDELKNSDEELKGVEVRQEERLDYR